jgi:hypothetical protein
VTPTADDVSFELFDLWSDLTGAARRALVKDAEGAGLSNAVRFAIAGRLQSQGVHHVREEAPVLRDAYSEAVQMHRRGEKERALRLIQESTPTTHADEFLKLMYAYFLSSPSLRQAHKRSAYLRSWVAENQAEVTEICASVLEEGFWSQWVVQFIFLEMCGAIHTLDDETGVWVDQILVQQFAAMRAKRGGLEAAPDERGVANASFFARVPGATAWFLGAS